MKTKYWIMALALLLAVSLGLSIPLFAPAEQASAAQIISDGVTVATVDLGVDRELTIDAPGGGYNTVTVKNGSVGVTAATCPDHYCMLRGMCAGGTEIVCLPNRLVIRFLGEQEVDALVG